VNDIAFITVGAMGGQFHGSLLSMILDAGAMVQFVLLLLLFFSIVSWAIILMKFKVLKKVKKENDAFLEAYMKGNKLSEIFPESKKFQYSTIAEVFRSGYTELIKVTKVSLETLTGKITIAAGDIVYLDLGRAQGLKTGNLLYIVRDVVPEQNLFDFTPIGKLPDEVLGALVVVETGQNTSTALVVKSIDAIYRGDRAELIKSK